MRITIVGGGTAGWITALYARTFVPRARVTLVESPEIGILGAGEGTTPHFVWLFLDRVGIPMSELVRECGATLKSGIRFHDWRGDARSYVHPFSDYVHPTVELPLVHPSRPRALEELHLPAHAMARGRAPLSPRTEGVQPGANPLVNLSHHGAFAAHFDAVRLAAYLKKVAIARGVEHIEGKVIGVLPDPSGRVDRLILEDGGSLGGDLFFDCTGFRRVLMGQHLRVPWVDVTDVLPVDSALPFSLPLSGPRLPQTDAFALDAGWMWRIPVEGRYGCGYVFDSNFASNEEARETVRTKFGPDVELPRVLRFRAGYLQDIWVKNVVAVGLSSGFLEPLEATSIWHSLQILSEFFKVHLPQNDDKARRTLNRYHRTLQERTIDFLHLHYLGGRSDTPFWATFRERTRRPPMSARIIDEGGLRWPFAEDPLYAGDPAPFNATSWLFVCMGLGLLDEASMKRYWDFFGFEEGYEHRSRAHAQRVRAIGDACVEHEALLDQLRGWRPSS